MLLTTIEPRVVVTCAKVRNRVLALSRGLTLKSTWLKPLLTAGARLAFRKLLECPSGLPRTFRTLTSDSVRYSALLFSVLSIALPLSATTDVGHVANYIEDRVEVLWGWARVQGRRYK